MTQLATTSSLRPRRAEPRRVLAAPAALTRRSLIIGFLLVAFVAVFTPYNDGVLQNSPFIGNHFPIGIITLVAALVLLVNPLLQRIAWRPLGTGELVVVLSMLLVGASVPSSGLMRYFEPLLVAPYWLAMDQPWLKPIAQLVPHWLVPAHDGASPVVSGFFMRPDYLRGEHMPWLAFLVPALLWSVLIGAVLGAAMFLAAIFRKQWVHHERLTYPLATIPLELLAAPEPGRYYNKLWRNGILWAGAAIPILIGTLNGLHTVWPATPTIDLRFDFSSSFTDHPWNNMPGYLAASKLYLSVVGICFFVPSEVAFSLWLFLVINGLLRVVFASSGVEVAQMEPVRGMGIYFAYFAGLLWLARRHLWSVLRGAWHNAQREEGEVAGYRTMVLGWLVCTGVAWAWLLAVGVQWWVGLLVLAIGTVMVTLMARIVAETGLFFVNSAWWPNEFFSSLVSPTLVSTKSFYWVQLASRMFFVDVRENIMPYATNAYRMSSEAPDVQRPKMLKWLFLAVVLSAVLSGAAHHVINYSYGRNMLEDNWAARTVPYEAMRSTFAHATAAETPGAAAGGLGRAWGNFAVGGVMVAVLMAGRVLFVSWPFHPIGLLLMSAGPLQQFWFSIFLGWGIKQLMLRYGGAPVFRRARPFFIGLIVGEILTAGVWMFIGLATNGAVSYRLLPG